MHSVNLMAKKNKQKNKMRSNKNTPRKQNTQSSSRDMSNLVASSLEGLMAGFEENSEAYHYVAHSGSWLFRSKQYLDLGTPQAGNVFQVKFLEPLLETFYTRTGIDKLDSTSQQAFYNHVIRSIQILSNLYWRHVPGILKPDLARDSTDPTKPMALVDWDNLMTVLEKVWQVPVLALNIFGLLKVVKQLSPGSILKRERPSYYLPFMGYRSLANLNTDIDTYLAEYDATLFRNQAKIPYVAFKREMVESIIISGVKSNFWDIMGQLIPSKSRSTSVTTHYFTADGASTADCYWSTNYSFRVPDLFAVAPLFRVYDNSNGGMIRIVDPADGYASIEKITIPVGGSWAEIQTASAIMFDPTLYLVNRSIGMNEANARGVMLGDRWRKVAAPLATASAWNLRFFAFAMKYKLVDTPLRIAYVGDAVLQDPTIMPLKFIVSPTGRTANDLAPVGG